MFDIIYVLYFRISSKNLVSLKIGELKVDHCSFSLISVLLRITKTLKKVEIRSVALEQTEVKELLEALSSCEVLEVLLLSHIDIPPEYVFSFITYICFHVISVFHSSNENISFNKSIMFRI